ncbi:extracellular aldonolactonase [Cordyceps javanica]|uniref:Extracellular aldonolactonase n=1 Tax=Cordyceps javanica TaxID=43265 RepID=A0A545V383_9HYPO|nr:extracellular aldonolactonase [Cordyceps javanica]TQW07470.1 extracellular aldonolactonase [Cordyceps javanica]
MARLSLAALLLAAGTGSFVAASDLLYVTSYAGTITTLDLSATSPAPNGGKVPVIKAVGSNQGCKPNPSWLTLNHAGGLLYCIDEGFAGPGGSLSAYRTHADGSLEPLGKAATPPGPVSGSFYGCKNRGFAVAHYGGSSFSTWDVSDPSNIKNLDNLNFTEPHGPKPEQTAPRPHETVLDPTGRFLIVPDLGTDLVRVFSFDSKSLQTTALPPVQAKTGSGPRHVAFAVKGPKTFMYLITELGNTIVGYEVTYEEKSIQFKEIFDIGVHGEGKPVPQSAAASEIVVSADNKFLIATSRRENSTTVPSFDDGSTPINSDPIINFSIDDSTGKLNLLQDVAAGGYFPRHFSVNKAGTRVAVGMQKDGRVVVIKRDPASGMLGEFESFANIEGEITSVIFDE